MYNYKNYSIILGQLKLKRTSKFCLFDVAIDFSSCFHQGLVVQQLKGVHLLSVFVILFLLHLFLQDILVLFVNLLQILCFILFILEKVGSILLPYICLLRVNFFLIDFLSFLFLNLTSQVISHLFFLFLLFLFLPLFFLLLFFELVLNVSQHFLILESDLFFLILDDRISERGHNMLYLILSFSFLLFSFPLEFVLDPCILLLGPDVLK